MNATAGSLPVAAACRYVAPRAGVEVLFLSGGEGEVRFEGRCTAVEAGRPWTIEYAIAADERWISRRAHVSARSPAGRASVTLEHDGAGSWLVDGERAEGLDGCLDLDLEASGFTNAFPVRRLELELGESGTSRAVWVRAPSLAVELLEQSYQRLPDSDRAARYRYGAPSLGFETEIAFDRAGLIIDYPGVATRAA